MAPLRKTIGTIGVVLAVCRSPVAAEPVDALNVEFGEHGPISLSFNGELLATPMDEVIHPINYTPVLDQSGRTFQGASEPSRVGSESKGHYIEYFDIWGTIEARYAVDKNKLSVDIDVINNSKDIVIKQLQLSVLELTFSEIPEGHVLDPGMFGTAGGWYALHSFPFWVQPDQAPPIIEMRDVKRKIDFVSEDPPSVGAIRPIFVPFSTNPGTKLSYPLCVSIADIPSGKSVKLSLSLRLGTPSAEVQSLSGDVLTKFSAAYPFQVEWPSRAPIGALFLATSQDHPERNPRGWFMNAQDIDVTTKIGLTAWRHRLLKFADDSVKVLKDIRAQGMITWDPEGEEYANSVYYGAPQLTDALAPETDFVSRGTLKVIDEYFAKFKNAGLRTGVAIRPQEIVFRDRAPVQQFVDDPLSQLRMKVRYARMRWGCTLFYIDSTVDANQKALSADVMQALHAENPGVLFIPENKIFRDYLYTAPFLSFAQGLTNTPASITEVYKDAFSVIQMGSAEAKNSAQRQALTRAVRGGDILLVNAWYPGAHTELVKDVYKAAGRWSKP